MKTCVKCKIPQEITEYHKAGGCKDGLRTECRSCVKLYRLANLDKITAKKAEWYLNNIERERLRSINYRLDNLEERKAWDRKYKKEHREEQYIYYKSHPWKQAARNAVQYVKVPEGYQKHHWSYNKEHLSDIIPLKTKIHRKFHTLMKMDMDLLIFRTNCGILLDTKEKHLKFLNDNIRSLDTKPPFGT